jgi:ketosteroid isomerase-like protein
MGAGDAERISQGFELFERGDLDEALSFVTPDFELNDTMIIEDTGERRGPEAMRENIRQLRAAFDEIRFEMLEFIDLGDRIVARVGAHFRGGQTGIEFDMEVGHIWTVRDGKAIRLDIFETFEMARREAGVEE